jgi:CRISPR system Cascade subunit CasD
MSNTLFLALEGPFQAWGERAHWSIRDTASEPTKSGIVGLLACACGWRNDDELTALSKAIRIGVRCERPGTILRDYHTVVGGVMSAEGKIKKNATTGEPETVVSERYYLADAAFLVVVQSEDANLIAHLEKAVQTPTWPFFLGRKSCVPSRPLYAGAGEYPDLETALRNFQPNEATRAVLECGPADPDAVRQRDEVISHSRRTFGPRYTRSISLKKPEPSEVP